MITKTEKAQIRQLLQMPQWKALDRLINEQVEKFKDEQVLFDEQWLTLRATLEREGKIRGITLLTQEIYNCLQNDPE